MNSLAAIAGVFVSIVPEALYKMYWSYLLKEPCRIKLKTYRCTPLTVTRKVTVAVEHNGQEKYLSLIAVHARDDSNTALLERD